MKFKVIGLVVALGLSLTGCSTGTSSQDLKACQDARETQLELSMSIALEDMSSSAQVSAKNSIFARRLESFSNTGIDAELSEALKTDAAYSKESQDYRFALEQTMEFCENKFGESLTDW